MVLTSLSLQNIIAAVVVVDSYNFMSCASRNYFVWTKNCLQIKIGKYRQDVYKCRPIMRVMHENAIKHFQFDYKKRWEESEKKKPEKKPLRIISFWQQWWWWCGSKWIFLCSHSDFFGRNVTALKKRTSENGKPEQMTRKRKLWAIRPTEQWVEHSFLTHRIHTNLHIWRIHFNELFSFRFLLLLLLAVPRLIFFWDVSCGFRERATESKRERERLDGSWFKKDAIRKAGLYELLALFYDYKFFCVWFAQMNYAYGPVDVLSAHLFLLNRNGFCGYHLLRFLSLLVSCSESARLFRFLVNRSIASFLHCLATCWENQMLKLRYEWMTVDGMNNEINANCQHSSNRFQSKVNHSYC